MKKIVLYFGHKLTNADKAFIDEMNHLKAILEERLKDVIVILKFLGTKDGSRHDVFKKDIKENVKTCDLFVCYVDEESTGLGIEIGAALWKCGRPILVLYSGRKYVSRLVGGTVDEYPDRLMERVTPDVEGVITAINEAIKVFKLDTPNPMTFPCYDSLCPGPLWGREADVYGQRPAAFAE